MEEYLAQERRHQLAEIARRKKLFRVVRPQASVAGRSVIIPGASHLFEEPGKLEEVARLAAEWFSRHLGQPAGTDRARF